MFNHAVRFYNLSDNPVKKAGTIGKGKSDEMEFWTEKEYLKFIEQVKDKSISYYAFQVLHITKSYLHKEMTRGAKKAGVKRITIHGLRHSHMKFVLIGE